MCFYFKTLGYIFIFELFLNFLNMFEEFDKKASVMESIHLSLMWPLFSWTAVVLVLCALMWCYRYDAVSVVKMADLEQVAGRMFRNSPND